MEDDQVSVTGNARRSPCDLHDFNAIAQWRGKHQVDKSAFIFLADGDKEANTLTFGELHHSACSVATWLQERDLVGERVLLLYPPGLDFIIGFLGCLYAGAIAVPAYPPHPRRSDPRLESIFEDCQPKAAFCIQKEVENLSLQLADHNLLILATDTLSPSTGTWESPAANHDSLAYLQYTSGSTGHPKGVMVTHGNLLHQCKYLANLSGHDENMVLVSWQPFFHDMGLVGTVATTIFTGAVCYTMAPAAFLRKPIQWLQAISRYRGTTATGPNFSFELCVTQTTPEQRKGLDLSSWKWAWNGAEPIRPDTLDRFCEVYEPFGFDRRTHFPSYGMAETTLSATVDRPDRLPIILSVQREALEQNHAVPCASEDPMAVELVSCGIWGDGMEIVIVEPETLEQRPDGYVGEIWVAGQSVAHGYWQRPQETEETFNAYIADSNRGPYLRTGDLGFVRDGELFVTGRLKDMIIIRGRNLYPHDAELVAQQSHDALQSDACAAFSIEVDGHEEIGLALEVKRTERRRNDFGDIFEAVRSAVVENHGVAIHWIGLIQPGGIPKTSSGKIMRRACRRDFYSGDLKLLAEWRTSEEEDGEASSEVVAPAPDLDLVQRLQPMPSALRRQTLTMHLQSEITRFLDLQSLPDPHKGFEHLGIDSLGAVKLVNLLQDQLDNTVELPTTLLFDQPNIEAVARYLEQALFGLAEKAVGAADAAPLQNEPVAIVGLACRFPDAADAGEFWQVLEEGKDTIREVPEERWDIDTYFDKDAGVPGKMNSRYGGFINGIEGFDAAFFDISPREATSMDPQHRHLLEVSWLALEDAGIAPATLDGRPVGVFVGISTGDYDQILTARGVDGADAFSATGNAHSAAAGRLSFLLGLQGPCLAVDTACSSSLVAVHQAVQSLRLGECEAAIAGGVNMVLRPDITVAFSRARLLAPGGRCKTFDAAADGYVRSEGCGMVVLKRLRDAERDGDQIHAVIRGSAVNQDGRSSGLTSPNGPSQTQVIGNALANGGVSPADVQYLECHGTGTVLGDPIEVQAANAAYSKGRDANNPLIIGSVKTNLGHLEAAAGMAGLIKVVLALKHARIPRSLHFQTPNPHIPWESLAVKVAGDALPWIADSRPRIAGVSSFGFAGTNAHVVVEGAPRVESKETTVEADSGPFLLALSARTEEALSQLAGLYADWLQTHDDLPLEDVCHTANTGRNHFEHRAVLLCTSREGVREQLVALARGERKSATALGVAPREGRRRVAFLFPGEGLQYSGMASDLYENEPVFRECLERCARVYDEDARENDSPPLKELMFHPQGMESSQQTRHIRAALYSLQVSLAALWRSWGVLPDALMGHSAGEYAAACVAGVFSVEDGLRLVMERARLLETLPAGGAMMSVTAPVDAVDAALEGDDSVSVSAYNGLNIVISGPVERLDALIERFEKEERYCTKLPATNAAHSLYVEPILEDFEAFARGIEYSAPGIPLVSGLFGAVIEPGSIPDATYWRRQTRQPVRFAQGIQALFETRACDVVVELGPQAELIWLAQMSHRPDHRVLWASSLEKGNNAQKYMLSTAAKLHANGADLDFYGIENADKQYRRLTLPTYPFQHKPFWAGPMGGIMRSELQEGLYRVNWEESEAQASKSSESSPQRWLILADDKELGAGIKAELEAFGQQVVTCPAMDSGSVLPGNFDAILEQVGQPGSIDQLLLVTGPVVDADASAEAISVAQSSGVQRALLVAQALISARSSTRLWLVTQGVQSVTEGETTDPTHAPVWGFGRTFAVEHRERFGGLVDLPLHGDAIATVQGLAKSLLCDDGENQLALRAGRRCVARLRSQPLPDKVSVNPKTDGSYLITGGTGALGLHLARHLVNRGAKQIILSSRSGANESAREVVGELEQSGCRVEIIQADLSQASQVERLLDQIDGLEGGHPLRGIVHAAGVLDGAPTVSQTPELYSKVMAPKLSGAWNLHRQTIERNLTLDFFVLFSSGAALLGFPWHGNYAAANAFLDSLALHRKSLGLPAVSINWGPWAGEGVATRLQALGWEELGTRLIAPRIALRLFDHLGNTPNALVCVHPMDWSRWNEQARLGTLAPSLLKLLDGFLSPEQLDAAEISTATPAGKSGQAGPLVRRLSKLDPKRRYSALVAHMQEQVGTVLGVPPEQIAAETGFFDLGMNSIMAVELRAALQTQLGDALEIQAAVIFNHPTIQKISDYLIDLLFSEDEPQVGQSIAVAPSVVLTEVNNLTADKLWSAIDTAAEQVLGASWVANTDDREDDAQRRKVLATILSLRAEMARLTARQADPVAIVGLSCRYPGASSADEFWQLLDEARDAVSEVPDNRWDSAAWRDAAPDNANMRFGGFLKDIEGFDAAFFGISPREAKSLDPQQRLLLEVAWEALENAGLAPSQLMGTRGGVFVGIQLADYAQRVNSQDLQELDAYAATGNALSTAAGRLAFTLGWQGPALAIDTACSSSLVSLHQACSNLRNGECDLALAGGVSIILSPMVSYILSRAQMLSKDGRCKTFDERANGFVRGEGCGMVVLKRLADAQRDGDRILSVIRGSAVNQDGRSSGLTVPNGLAQQQLIRDALAMAGIEPAAVQYLEAHGTGTSLGDPIEVQAANDVFSQNRDSAHPLLVGAVKSNIGHTETAAGIAGVIKVVLSMQHEKIPQSLHFKTPNSHIPWDHMKLKVAAESVPWPAGEERRIAGVSSFGFGGTNAHVVLEEAPDTTIQVEESAYQGEYLLAISARNANALAELAGRYADWVDRHTDSSLADLCHTANMGRNHFEERAALVFGDRNQLGEQLRKIEQGLDDAGIIRGRAASRSDRQIAFLFTGQGSQRSGMGRELYHSEPVFREHFDRCADVFARQREGAPDLRELVFEEDAEGQINQTGFTQPALYALEVSLVALWRSWGVESDLVLGHSVGEYAAAYTAGVFSLEEGMSLITERGRLMQSLPSGGGMAAVSVSADRLAELLRDQDEVCIGAFNGADTVISGPQVEIDALLEQFESQNLRCKRLVTSHAFHSKLMDPILDEFREFAAGISYRTPSRQLISNVTGEIVAEDQVLNAEYWTTHLRQAVQFEQGVRSLQDIGCDTMLEIGPHPVLVGMGQGCWDSDRQPLWVGSLRRGHSDIHQVLTAAGQLYARGTIPDFAKMEGESLKFRKKLSLPTYPFQHKRYWIDPPQSAQIVAEPRLEDCLYRGIWEQRDVDPSSTQQDASGSWLVFCDEGGTGKSVCQVLKARGDRVVQVDANSREIGSKQTLAECIDDAEMDGPIQKVLYLGCLDSTSIDSVQDLQRAQESGVESVLRLTQILIDREWEGQLWLATRGVQRVLDSDRVEPAQSTLWGLGKVISMERPRSWGGLVDLPLDAGGDSVADQLVAVCDCGDFEDQVALREGRRWVVRLLPEENLKPAQLEVEREGSYLITGGLGGIGLQIAHRLVQRGARYLVLTSRSAPSQAAETAIRELEEQGCDIRVIQGDVSREKDVLRLFDEIGDLDLPVLKGIVHAAGVESVVALEDVTVGELQSVMAAKVFGAWLLDRIALERGIELSFFVCTSSISSVWGSVKQASYAAGNAFLTALCEHRLTEGRAATAVCYGPWKEVGMGASGEDTLEWLRSRGVRALSSSFALDGMETMIMGGVTGTALADINWPIFRALLESQRPRPLLENLDETPLENVVGTGNDSSPTALESLRAASESERSTLLATIIRDEVSHILSTEPEMVSDDVSWFELGMDSLMAMEVTNRLRRRFGDGALSVEAVYQQPTVGELKAALMKSLDLSPQETGVGEGAEVASDAGLSASSPTEWPASIGQKRIWFLQQMAPTSPQFNLPAAVRFKKGLCVDLTERVLGELVRRHSALRTIIENSNGELVQVVQQWSMPELRVVDISKDTNLEDRLKSIQEEEARRPIDIMGGSLIRFTLVNLAASDQALLITMHHAISDGVSYSVLLREFLALYEAFARNEPSPLPQPKAQFVDYAAQESRQLLKRTTNDSVAYWKEELRGIPPLELPSDRVRPTVLTHVGDSVPVNLSGDIRDELRAFSQRAHVTPFVTLLAAWSLLLSRYSGQEDFGVGTPVAGRDGQEWSDVIGIFINMLTLRVQLDQDWTVRELLAQAEAVTKRAYEHQALPFDWLVGQLNPTRDPGRTPLFQVALILEVPIREFQERLDSEEIVVSDLQPMMGSSQFDITLDLVEKNTGFGGFLEYNTDLFDRWRMEQMVEHFKILLSAMIRQPDAPISELPLSGSDERQYLLTQWNRTNRDYPLDQCVHEGIAEQALHRPDEIAVVCGEAHLTYRELNRRANQLAHYLQDRGVGAETLVGLCVERSLDMVVAVLGVMKAGGAYVPLDPDFPKHRLELMLEDADVKVLVSQTQLLDRLPERDAEVICLDREADRIARESTHDPEQRARPDNAVYVIYTSGSTGKPKGVVITHRSLLNFLFSMAEETAFDSQEILLAVTTLSFDISKLEILLPLLKGARVVIATREEARDANLLRKVLVGNNATMMQATPATWRMLLASGWNKSEAVRVLCGGEVLGRELAESLLEVTDSLWNVYGPTETTIWSAIQQVREVRTPTVPIGHPLANTQLHILDGGLNPSPVGVPGELFIGGDGLARGYLNQPDLTQERFVPDPFAESSNARLYRTGDLCCRMPDGNIEFMGRLDNQVKVRGFRVEIGDIEDALSACEGIRQAAVTTWKGSDGFDVLAGYLVADSERRPGVDEIKATLRELLPGYMVPGMLMYLDELPLTPNKKVDRRALPSPDLVREQAQAEFIAPQTEQQMALADIWKEVLKVETIGIRDNFFDLGGHSLQIVEILSRLKQRFEIEMSVVDLFQYTTIEALAEYLEQPAGKPTPGDEPGKLAAGMGAESKVEGLPQSRVIDGRVYTYRRYCEGDRASALASYAKSFSQNSADVLDAALEWKYLDSNSMPGDGSTLDVLDCDGDIVGMSGKVSARFKIEDNTIPGYWESDFHLVPDHRIVSGWAWSEIARHSSGLKLSMPHVDLYPVLSEAKAVIDIDQYVTLVACLDLGAVLKTRGWPSAFSSISGFLYRPLPAIFDRYTRARAATGIDVIEISRFDERFDQFWQVVSSDYPAIMVRDQAFLSWRFDRCPIRDYTRYAAVREGEVIGYIVTRNYVSEGTDRGMIVDYLVRRNDYAVLSALIRTVMQDFRSRGTVSVKCSLSSSQREHIRQLRSHGFLIQRPGAYIVAERGFDDKSLAANDDWFITYADGDLDY